MVGDTFMAGKIEIVVKKEIILAEASKLERIAQSVSQKRIGTAVSNSKGMTAESINNLIDELNSIGVSLSDLMLENAKNVRLIAEQFSEMDSNISSAMRG